MSRPIQPTHGPYVYLVENWADLTRIFARAEELSSPLEPAYLLRGQARSDWGLAPSFVRLARDAGLTRERALQLEAALVEEFKRLAPRYLPPGAAPHPMDILNWWIMMQHYGAATRLLDWTASPYVATYFAVEQELEHAGAVWMIRTQTIRDAYGVPPVGGQEFVRRFLLPHGAPSLAIFRPSHPSERMTTQQTHMIVAGDVLGDHDELLAATVQPERRLELFVKLEIAPEMKLSVLRHLRRLNITARSLFPGVDGLGRSVTELARLGLSWLNTLSTSSAQRTQGTGSHRR